MFVGKEDFKVAYRTACIDFAGKALEECSNYEKYDVLVQLIKNRASKVRTETRERIRSNDEKQIYYFSMEFLIGRLLNNYLLNLGIQDIVRSGLREMGQDLDEICQMERDPGLGNGGLGRLAACFLDSMAFLGVPGTGMGIRYRFGLFQQKIVNGYQTEEPDTWLDAGYPWETQRPDQAIEVKFGGYVDREYKNGKITYNYKGYQEVLAVPYDVPVVGYGARTVNQLRLWYAQPKEENFDLAAFNRGDYAAAVKHRNEIEAITCILYPDDSTYPGKKLRLQQEYLLVAAGIGDIVRHYKETYGTNQWAKFPERVAIHINDTHPTMCVPELMRLLMDEEGLEWDEAWEITTHTIAYTNHTVLPEALEKWPIDMLQNILPRVYMIIEEIDRRYRENFDNSRPNAEELRKNTAILWDGQAKMANLSIIGSHSVNGVASLHTQILEADTLKAFYILQPEKFSNKTNGVSHRRFLIESNPGLTRLITDAIGPSWVYNPMLLEQLLPYKEDSAFLERMAAVKRENKVRLANYIQTHNGVAVDPDSVFDIQVKRIHAYKRQLLFAFKIMDVYNQLKENPDLDIRPHTFIFAGKAAGSYVFAKEVVKLINSIADVVNNDPAVNGKIKVVFIENFCVSTAQLIYPAAEISEQISTAGKEASGTGNMKFMFNGAITLGTMDGANVEIHSLVGDENIRIFGMRADEVEASRAGYHPQELIEADPRLKTMTDQLINGFFHASGCDFWGIRDALLTQGDEYFVLKDFDDYVRTWKDMNQLYLDTTAWNRISLHNIAKAGYFSSDRTIAEYAKEIWGVRCERH